MPASHRLRRSSTEERERSSCPSTCSPSATRSPTPRRRSTSRCPSAGASGKFRGRLVNPANRRRLTVIVVGTGLAGGSAAATLGEAGYKVKSFWYQDSPRRAHSVAAQGGINAAKNYRNDGDSVYRLFYDTVKGGDFRSRESNSYRLAEVSVNIIDQCRGAGRAVRPRVRRPARQPLVRWRAGVAHLLRPRPDGPAAALRRLPGARAADRGRQRRAARAHRDARPDRRRRAGPRHRRPRPGHRRDQHALRRRRRARHRRLRQRLLPVDQRQGLQRHGDLAGAQAGRLLRQPLLHADPPDLHPGQRRLPVEADADERVAAQRRPGLGAQGARRHPRPAARSPRTSATTTWSASTRRSATWCPATSPRGRRRTSATRAAASGPGGLGVYLDFADAIERLGRPAIEAKYGNLFDMYAQITGEDPYQVPMRVYPAVHYTMGGLWVDYDLQSNDPRPVRHRRGELLRPRRQPAGRQRADAGPGRRLLRAAGDHQRLPGRRPVRHGRRQPPGRRRGGAGREGADPEAAGHQRHPQRRLLPPRAGQADVGPVRHGALRGEPAQGAGPDPGAAAGVLDEREGRPATGARSTRTWSTPAGSPTSSSSPS